MVNTGAMRFQAEHRFGGSVQDVARVLSDPAFHRDLALPDLSRPEVEARGGDGSRVKLLLRYEFEGSLDPMARRLIGHHRLAWMQELVVDLSDGSGELAFHAVADAKRLHGRAGFTMEGEGGHCVRRLSGELVVAVPVIGSRAESRIVPGILRRLDIEADAVNDVLGGPLR